MSDSEDKPAPGSIPSWQRDSSAAEPSTPSEPHGQLEVARRFLENDAVKNAPAEEKAEFLRTKGIGEEDIQKLLSERSSEPTEEPSSTTTSTSTADTPTPSQSTASPEPSPPFSDRPPVITYPEFLTKRERPPPLLTSSGVFTTLSSLAGLATLLYGMSNFLVAPMVDSLTAARHELHDVTAERLEALNAILEATVSEIPPTVAKRTDRGKGAKKGDHDDSDYDDDDEDSQADDPTEMFHRDIGTQTSLPSPPPVDFLSKPPQPAAESPSRSQSAHLTSLNQRLASLRDDLKSQSSELEDVKALIDVFRDDLDEMTFGAGSDMVGGYDVFGKKGSYAGSKGAKKGEDDEIKKVRDGIRRVKGVLLSTRNFPASVR